MGTMRGRVLRTFKLDRLDEARDLWQKVLAISPKDAKALAAIRELNRQARHGHKA